MVFADKPGRRPGERKIHHESVPLAGGFAVLTGILLPLLIGAGLIQLGILKISFANLIAHGFERRGIELGAIASGSYFNYDTGLA